MFPRLQLLRELLSEEGTIAIHLDHEELPYCMTLMDEIFGRKNRIALCTFKQSSVSGPKSVNAGVVSICSYIMLYAKNKRSWKSNKVFRPRDRDSRYASFIENRDEPTENWEVTPLSEALENEFGLPIKDIKAKFNVKYEEKVHKFVIANRNAVIRTARVKPKDIREKARPILEKSIRNNGLFLNLSGKISQVSIFTMVSKSHSIVQRSKILME